MIKWLGVILVWGGCGIYGLWAATCARQRVRLLEDLGQALELLERELLLNRAALPELFARLERRSTPQGSELFSSCKRMMEQGSGIAQAWETALKQSELRQEEVELLSCLSQVLGRYDAQGQAQALVRLRQELERRSVLCREEARTLSRLYPALGITAGGFVTLTLF